MLRRRSFLAVAPRAIWTSVALGLLATLATAAPALAEPSATAPATPPAAPAAAAPAPTASLTTASTPTCADVVAAAAATAPEAPPEGDWATWWPTSALDAARLAPACTPPGRTPAPEPVWRAQVALRLAASVPGRQPLGQWLLRTAFPPTRVINPIAAIIDDATEAALATTPACTLQSSLVASVLWMTNPSLVDGELHLADDGTPVAGEPAGLPALQGLLGITPAVTDPPTPAPTLPATTQRIASWLCERPVDLASPEGRGVALAPLVGDATAVGAASMAVAQMGTAPLDPHVTIPLAGGRARQKLTAVGSFRVNASVAPHLTRLLADAAADGIELTGGGYRSGSEQVERRRANCAGPDGVADDYDLYEKPSKQCSPRTARPGLSLHETGEAIDFERCQTHDTPCFQWLARYAHRYGLVNLPVEPWHWSVNGQ